MLHLVETPHMSCDGSMRLALEIGEELTVLFPIFRKQLITLITEAFLAHLQVFGSAKQRKWGVLFVCNACIFKIESPG